MLRCSALNASVLLLGAVMGGLVSRAAVGQAKPAPAKVRLSAVLAAFLVDSGVKTRGLAWTTGSALPVVWATPGPVANPDKAAGAKGLPLIRSGTFTGTVGDTVALAMTVQLTGAESGLTRVMVGMMSMAVTGKRGGGFVLTREMVELALKHEGVALTPLKCSRAKEGASYGNLVDVIKLPGKTASGLWWYWDSPAQRMLLNLTLMFRRTDVNEVECASGS